MMKWPFGKKKAEPAPDAPKILRLAGEPAAVYAIGDVHGCLDLFDAMEAAIVADGADLPGQKLIVYLGDLVDRGAHSATILERVMAPAPAGFQRVVLQGNHEFMMQKFLEQPAKNANWLMHGGVETLMSYGIAIEPGEDVLRDVPLLTHRLESAVPATHREFLANLPCALEIGKWRFAHAGYDLSRTADQQSQSQLIWGPPEHADQFVSDLTLVHGHVPVDEVTRTENRINVDLGSYKSGRLGAVRFIQNKSCYKVLAVGGAPNTSDISQDLNHESIT